ncbi:ATP-dependent RNA helicase DbpA [Robbsia sp. Bb-Pol-6]|uniref:ATP-dependent RNA helicase DbpA n=1 Tax=Robbsia betulipollinis TaxID=2981849 RepID=A0ABT3ZRQ7_9BURK|nr:ATP-dependent RNA helicase DbpA [Robbsia betulipollinis]MCY0389236.1 ATP-dependent RNA helicase DbpA [Robbsia betulipollinis]
MTESQTPPAAPDAAAAAFEQLPLSPAMLANLAQLGYRSMTPIQAASLPVALAGHDLIAQAKTGSGKTAAFALALLTRLEPRRFDLQAMVLCPTRELADQVAQEIRRLARAEENIKILTLCGGASMRPQIASLEHGAHIVVGTPGRIIDHLDRGSLQLDTLRTLVLDEADRMLDMGFYDDIAAIAQRCPKERQTLLFSATYPEGIGKLSQQFLRKPQQITVEAQHAPSKIRQVFYEIDKAARLPAVAQVLDHFRPVSALAFCNTRRRCGELVEFLRGQGFEAQALHGELEQRERDQVLIQFANRSCSVLVATDVAARGLDIDQLALVINVDVTPDPEVHIHRVGRTGRADHAGTAVTLASLDEMGRVASVEQALGNEIRWEPLDQLAPTGSGRLLPPMATLQILGGRKEKIRPGDVQGALTGAAGYTAAQIGKINITDFSTYVAVERSIAKEAARRLNAGTIKGKTVRVRLMRD